MPSSPLSPAGGATITPAAPATIDLVAQPPHVLEAGMADADDHLAVAGAADHALHHLDRFVGGELVRLAHHAEQREAMNAAADVEIGQRVDALQVERAVVGERRGGDDVDAFGVFGEFCEVMRRSCQSWRAKR